MNLYTYAYKYVKGDAHICIDLVGYNFCSLFLHFNLWFQVIYPVFFFLLFFIPTTNIIFKHFISSHPLYLCYSLWDQFLLVDIVNLVITRFSPATQFIFHGIVCLQSACMCINFIYACTFVSYICIYKITTAYQFKMYIYDICDIVLMLVRTCKRVNLLLICYLGLLQQQQIFGRIVGWEAEIGSIYASSATLQQASKSRFVALSDIIYCAMIGSDSCMAVLCFLLNEW